MLWSGIGGWERVAYTWWAAILLVLAFTDAAVLRLPHRLTAATTLGLLVLLALEGGSAAAWWTAFAAAGGLAAIYSLFHLAAPSGLGLGDVGLAVPIGLALGWQDWRYPIAAVLLAHTAALLTIAVRRLRGRSTSPLPFGVYLVTAAIGIAGLAP